MSRRKVFGIGFQKTGTTTLGLMFDKLGYRLAGYNEFRHLAARESLNLAEVEALAIKVARGVDAAKDTPWPILYRTLDRTFPGSKFIHVVRDSKAWINSAVKDFGAHSNALHQVIYGSPCPKGHEADWVARYERHNAEVRDYFADRPDDCLFLSLESDLDVARICDFLGETHVAMSVPRANTRLKKKVKTAWWRLTKSR
jgi:hypothetical protein